MWWRLVGGVLEVISNYLKKWGFNFTGRRDSK